MRHSPAREIFWSAGDPSGDLASGLVVSELRASQPEVRVWGLGGERLRSLGQEQLAEPSELAVLGFWEVAKRAAFFRNLLSRTAEEIRKRRPACVVLVDYPGFNLRLAQQIRSTGIPIVYYIAPQVWAWHASRVRLIRRLVDRLLVILPFEAAWFGEHGVQAEYVGHYLLDDMPAHMIASALPERRQLAVLPGSRRQEVERMLPSMLAAAVRFCETNKARAVVAGMQNGADYRGMIAQAKADAVELVVGKPREVIHASSIVLTASGTATLEAGIIARPMVICYRTSPLTFWIARKLVRLPAIGLVNLVLGETVAPELLQERASPDLMYTELMHLLETDLYADQYRRLCETHLRLGKQGASARVADVVRGYL